MSAKTIDIYTQWVYYNIKKNINSQTLQKEVDIMTARIKTWKIREIMRDMSKYGDAFIVDIEGHTFGTHFIEAADKDDYVKVKNIYEIIKETEKAVNVSIDGFKTWIPKSAIIF